MFTLLVCKREVLVEFCCEWKFPNTLIEPNVRVWIHITLVMLLRCIVAVVERKHLKHNLLVLTSFQRIGMPFFFNLEHKYNGWSFLWQIGHCLLSPFPWPWPVTKANDLLGLLVWMTGFFYPMISNVLNREFRSDWSCSHVGMSTDAFNSCSQSFRESWSTFWEMMWHIISSQW